MRTVLHDLSMALHLADRMFVLKENDKRSEEAKGESMEKILPVI